MPRCVLAPSWAYVERLAQQPAIAAALERERLPLHTYKKPA